MVVQDSDGLRTIIVGAGIVGSSLAKHLSAQGLPVVLVDTSLSTSPSVSLPGSTGHAPGFVGQLNELPSLTELAKRSVKDYRGVEGGFDVVGGLELAESDDGVKLLEKRLALAHSYELPARLISAQEASERALAFVGNVGNIKQALLFESDGTARAQHIARSDRTTAVKQGAQLVQAKVTGIARDPTGAIIGVDSSTEDLPLIKGNRVIVATGIWTQQLLPSLAVHPVAHPYTHSATRPTRTTASPFVRWPESHVYARDHGDYDGIGSYDHPAISVAAADLTDTAYGPWETSFDHVLNKAFSKLPKETSTRFVDGSGKPFNGLFSMTPDNLPFLGKVEEGIWCAVAVWVTHAAGCADLLARKISGAAGWTETDQKIWDELDPNRFKGFDEAKLRQKSLRAYNDIYNRDES